MGELAEVLATHRNVSIRRGMADRRGIALNENVCQCGEVLPWGLSAMEAGHNAHVADAVLAWIDARLGEADVLEAVCEAVALVSGEVDMGETEAAIGAVRGVLGLEVER